MVLGDEKAQGAKRRTLCVRLETCESAYLQRHRPLIDGAKAAKQVALPWWAALALFVNQTSMS